MSLRYLNGMSSFWLGHRVIAEECGVFWPCSFRWTVLLLGRRSSWEELRADWCIDVDDWVYPYKLWRSAGIHKFFSGTKSTWSWPNSTSTWGWFFQLYGKRWKRWSASDRYCMRCTHANVCDCLWVHLSMTNNVWMCLHSHLCFFSGHISSFHLQDLFESSSWNVQDSKSICEMAYITSMTYALAWEREH